MNSSPPGILHRVTSTTASDEFLTHSSVA
jgi:hypothetical protein